MPTATLFAKTGVEAGTVDLPESLFAATVNESVMHQAVVAQLAGRRLGTHDTKTRGEVAGGGTTPGKVFKGTGMAGRMGGDRVTVKKATIVRADAERKLLLVKGPVPGARNALVLVRKV